MKSPNHEVIPQNLDEISFFKAIKAKRESNFRNSYSPPKIENGSGIKPKQIDLLFQNSVDSTQPTINLIPIDAGPSIDKELDSF